MATLQQIGTSGMAGLAPTPVQAHVIRNYLSNDELMNMMQYVNIAQGTSLGNFVASFVLSDGDMEATFRDLGLEYDENTEQFKTDSVYLKILGGSFKTDIEIARAFGQGGSSVAANWTEEQFASKLDAIKRAFAKYFILGDSESRPKEFDGIEKKIDPAQILAEPINVGNMTDEKAFQVELAINKVINRMGHKPNAIVTTKNAKAVLNTLNAYRHRGIEAIEVNGLKYDQYAGIPVIGLEDYCFKPEENSTTNKQAVYLLYIHEREGIRVAIPLDGEVVKALAPKFDGGNVTQDGTCEMACAPIFANKKAMAKLYIDESVAAAAEAAV